MINNTLKTIEEEFDREFVELHPIYFLFCEVSQLDGTDMFNRPIFYDTSTDQVDRVKSFLKSSIIKVLQQLVENIGDENEKAEQGSTNIAVYMQAGINMERKKQKSYLKSEIEKLSTNIDKE